MAIFIPRILLSHPNITDWQDINISAHVPVWATGVILEFTTITWHGTTIGFRKKGSTDNRAGLAGYQNNTYICVGLDENKVFQAKINNAADLLHIVGYFGPEAVFFTNAIDKSISPYSQWNQVDITSDVGGDPAIGAIIEHFGGTSSSAYGLRKNGSSDARQAWATSGYYSFGQIIGLDVNKKFETYLTNSTQKVWLIGYIKNNATFNTNATDASLSTTGAWTDLPVSLPGNATGAVIEVIGNGTCHLRANGSSDTYYPTYSPAHAFAFVGCDGSGLIEGKISDTSKDFFIVGYFIPPVVPVANFTASITAGNCPLTVNFTDTSTGPPGYWEWDFGDGTAKSYVQNPSHQYTVPGTYTVKLTVSNELGYDDEIKTAYINVYNVGTLTKSLPKIRLLIEAWEVIATLPKIICAAGGYWTWPPKCILPKIQIVARGERISNDFFASMPKITAYGIGESGVSGTAYLTLPKIKLSARGPYVGTLIQTLPKIKISATGNVTFAGKLIAKLPKLKINAIGSSANDGSILITIPRIKMYSSALRGLMGYGGATLPLIKVYANGLTTLNLFGTAHLTIPKIRISASGLIIPIELFETFVINTRNSAVSTYDNYNYNSFAKFNGKYLGANTTNGIFLLEGDKDVSANINAEVATGLINMGTDKLKRITHMFIRMISNGLYEFRFITDNGYEYSVSFGPDVNPNLHPVLAKPGKGAKGEYWKFKFLNSLGADFEIDTMEIKAEITSRKT